MEYDVGRLLACDCAKPIGSVGSETPEEVSKGAGVDEIATLLRAWVKVDVAGAGSVGTGEMAGGKCIGLAGLDGTGGVARGAGISVAWLDETVEV